MASPKDKQRLKIQSTYSEVSGLIWKACHNFIQRECLASLYTWYVLDNMCFADYIDRITFQKQIWIFNEMSSLIKTFKSLVLTSFTSFETSRNFKAS